VRILSHPILGENGARAMPGSISLPNSGLLVKKNELTGNSIGHTKKIIKSGFSLVDSSILAQT
jgi:hypothetical protein